MGIPVRKYWRLLAAYLKDQRGRVGLLAALLVATVGLQLIRPQFLRYFIDAARAGAAVPALVDVALLFMAAAVVEQSVRLAAAFLGETVGWSATNALRLDLARHALRLDMSFHNTHTPGELIERIDGDITALANFFSRFVLQVTGNGLLIVGVLALLWREHLLLGACMTALTAVGMFAINYVRARGSPYWVAGRQASADLAGFFEERLAGLEDIRASGAASYKLRLLYEHGRNLFRRYLKARIASGVTSNLTWIMQAATMITTLGIGASLYFGGQMTIGTVFLVVYYARLMSWPLAELIFQMDDLQQAEASITRVEELKRNEPVVRDGPGAALPAGAPSVEFEDVTFAYYTGNIVLQDVSFRLDAGRTLGVLGRTGSGKTTLTRLLFRLYDPDCGSVHLAGADLRATTLADARSRIGLVTQEVQLFGGTVRDNLTFFDRTISDERIWDAITALGLGDWYRVLPQGLDTILASGGGGLSAGEAQLLAFTRVLLKDPGLVILDEASSRLDPVTERLIEGAVDRLLSGRTGIIIAHRLGTIQRVDEILIMENGQVIEQGDRRVLAGDPASRLAGLLRTGLEEAMA